MTVNMPLSSNILGINWTQYFFLPEADIMQVYLFSSKTKTMKRKLLFSLFGAVIIFVWQFLSYAMPNLHKSAMQYTPGQEKMLQSLKDAGMTEGMYVLGQPDPTMSREQQASAMKDFDSKPWAIVNYHEKNSVGMAMPMIRGFLVCLVMAFLLFYIFLQQKNPTLQNRILLSLTVGLIGFFFEPYTNFIWFRAPDIFAHFADAIVPWLILGFVGHKMAPVDEK